MKLVHFPESPDPRFKLYLDVLEEGCIYVVRKGVLMQHGRFLDDSLDEGAPVSGDGVEEEARPYLREVEALLHDAGRRLPQIDRLFAEYKRKTASGGEP